MTVGHVQAAQHQMKRLDVVMPGTAGRLGVIGVGQWPTPMLRRYRLPLLLPSIPTVDPLAPCPGADAKP